LFDIAFSELIVIAIVALIVIGPEKLPKVARTLGALAGRMQRYIGNVKADIERQMQFEDLQKLQQEIKQGANSIHSGLQQAQSEVVERQHEIERSIDDVLADKQASESASSTHPSSSEDKPKP
jgi:sec-independent protein translocase protein TatB